MYNLDNYWRLTNIEPFSNPYDDIASKYFPRNFKDALKFCEAIVLTNGIYKSALERIVSFFVTDLEIENAGIEDARCYKDYLYDELKIDEVLHDLGMDFLVYGNCILSLVSGYQRLLFCPKCGLSLTLKAAANSNSQLQWRNYEFYGICPSCNKNIKWESSVQQLDKYSIKRWNIHEIELVWDAFTEDVKYYWHIPSDYKQAINKGEFFVIERVPHEIINAVKEDVPLSLSASTIFHAKDSTLCGIENRGWGISRVLSTLRQSWYVQVIYKANEAVGMDYLLPLRIITPHPQGGSVGGVLAEPVFQANLGSVAGMLNAMLAKRRRDPAAWFVLPFPVQYQMFGAEGKMLMPRELLDQATDTLFNAIGIPIELYRGSLSVQAAPLALRLMESYWHSLYQMFNRFLLWLSKRLITLKQWQDVRIRIKRPQLADELQQQMAKLQLMQMGQVSRTTGLGSVGMDFATEQRRIIAEEKFLAEESEKAQKELQGKSMGEAMATGGMQPGMQGGMGVGGGTAPGGPTPQDPIELLLSEVPEKMQQVSLEEMDALATAVAQKIYGAPATLRLAALRELKSRNEAIHALVRTKLEELDVQAERMGRMQARGQ